MKTKSIIVALTLLSLVSCVSKKKYQEALDKQQKSDQEIAKLSSQVTDCGQQEAANTTKIKALEDQVAYLKESNQGLINNVGNLTTLTQKGAETLEKSLESMKEKDMRIKDLSDALTKKDSVTFALVNSIKGVLGDLSDDDIQVNVEKGVVYVSISDKLLFKSGSYTGSGRAKEVLGKVAKVVNNKPDFEIMVEGHTDNVPLSSRGELEDNWDLSVKRATSVGRIFQTDFKVAPERMIASGRSYYLPLETNKTDAGRAKNRRTKIMLLPKLDQFYKMLEEEMKAQQK